MNDLRDVWLLYCADRPEADPSPENAVAMGPWDVLEAFWTFFPMFRTRQDVIRSIPYSTGFDDAADEALTSMAMTDSFEAWEIISAGAWRVLYERLMYCSVVVAANAAAGTSITDHLPAGLDRQSTARALLLRYLLGRGRTIDRRLLPQAPLGSAPAFPEKPIWRQ